MFKPSVHLRAVIFDMDGVITNTMPDHYRAWKVVLTRYGYTPTHLDIYKREGQPGIISIRDLFAEKDLSFPERTLYKVLSEKERLFKKIVKQRFIPGARRFLHWLYQQGFILALVTGTSRHELHKILPDHLYKLFSAVVTGNDVKMGKPHPEPFLKAMEALKVKSTEAIVIENAPFGIQSAKSAGLKCLAVQTSLPKEFLNKADQVFHSIKDLSQYPCFTRPANSL